MIDHSTTSILSMASSSSLSSVATFASSYPTSLDHLSWKLCSPNPLSALFPIGRTKSHLRDSKEGFIRACNHSSQAHGTDILMTRRGTFTAAMFLTTASGALNKEAAEAVSTSRRALKGEKVPESEYKTMPNGLKYYDLKVGGGSIAKKGSRVTVHYVVKWRGVTFMTSRQGLGVTGGTPYGFDTIMIALEWRWFLVIAIVAVVIRLIIMTDTSEFPRDLDDKLQRSEIIFTPDFIGPESLAFDAQGKGPYTGVADGRIMFWDGPKRGWIEFAHTSPNRTAKCNTGIPPSLKLEEEHICGRPLGMRFDEQGNLYIADAYCGLYVVGPEGGPAKVLVTEVEGVPLAFTNDVEFGENGLVYFTDSSSKYHRRDFVSMFMGGDESGRLLTYNPSTGKAEVILHGLQFPNGLAISKDKSFLIISETLTCRALRLWLKGAKKGQLELFAKLPGYPDNVRRTESGDFWIAIHSKPNILLKTPLWLRRGLLKLPLSFTGLYTKVSGRLAKGMIIRLSEDGIIKEVIEDSQGKVVRLVSEVEEHDGKLWLGSVILPQIAVYRKD